MHQRFGVCGDVDGEDADLIVDEDLVMVRLRDDFDGGGDCAESTAVRKDKECCVAGGIVA